MPSPPQSGRAIRSVSVLMPTWQGERLLERVLASLAAQRFDLPWDFLAVDSGSTDGTLGMLERADLPVPLRVHRIQKLEFDHGDTRNLLAAMCAGDLLVFLTQDAIPIGPDWLATLVANFDDTAVGAVTCRNVARADAHPLTRLFVRDDPGYAEQRREVRLPPKADYEALDPHGRRLLYNFNDVASALRRELWELFPFPRTDFGEDVLMARALLEAGWTVVYDADAAVEHSHDYDEDETFARAASDGRFNAEWLGRVAIGSREDADALARRLAAADESAIRAAGYGGDRARDYVRRARRLRAATFRGLHQGGRSQRRRPPSGLLERRALKVLYVVHGFPPDTWAGTEVYTLNLAQAIAKLGHEVVVFARVPPGGDEDVDCALRERDCEGLRVLALTHAVERGSLRESYHQPRIEQAFRRVLRAEAPDVVHFQHLIHTSVGLVDVARELGIATLIHCHDYWPLCARVQLIRPDGVRCEENMGAGCCACVKDKHLGWIPTLRRLGAAGGAVFAALADELGLADFAVMAERNERVLSAYADCDLQVSPSRFLREKLLETGRFDPHALLFSDNGLGTDHVRAEAKRPDAEGRFRFGFVGSLVWYKGGEVMVRAMARLAGTSAVLHVHGDFRPDEDPHHAVLRSLAGDNVRFLGRFDNARLSAVYAEIDVLVVPSVWFENSPLTIHEAFLSGTPVIASGIGGMAEYVRDGVDGLHFDAGDDQSLAAAMRRFIDEPELCAALSRDFPPLKTIAEDARATEFRYRALVCRRRVRRAATLYDGPGSSADRREGPVDEQGADMLLLRPGGAAVEYDLGAVGAGEREVRVDVQALASESALQLGGRVLLDGEEIGGIAAFSAVGRDEVKSFRLAACFAPGGPWRLRIESALAPGGPEVHLRILRVVVREPEDAA